MNNMSNISKKWQKQKNKNKLQLCKILLHLEGEELFLFINRQRKNKVTLIIIEKNQGKREILGKR